MEQRTWTLVAAVWSTFITLRALWLVAVHRRWVRAPWVKQQTRPRLLVVLGSGGHTAEMLAILRAIDLTVVDLACMVAQTDVLSREQMEHVVLMSANEQGRDNARCGTRRLSVTYMTIPRSREVGQGFVSSLWSTLVATAVCARLLLSARPDLILLNGPGTSVPPALAARCLEVVGILWSPVWIVFIESLCRVRSLSLSGKLLYPVCDTLIVQWPELATTYSGARYIRLLA